MKSQHASRACPPRFVWRRLFCLVLCAGGIQGSAYSGVGDVSTSEAPEWVVPVPWEVPDGRSSKQSKTESTVYVLTDIQHHPKKAEYYRHTVRHLLNESAVQQNGQVVVDFDPTYEEVIFHKVVIHRDGQELDQLDLSKLKVFQPEDRMSQDIYVGDKRALIFLEDLRVGDSIEVAWSRHGNSRVLGDRYSYRMAVRWSVPVEKSFYRLLWDDSPIAYQSLRCDMDPVVLGLADGGKDLRWHIPPQPALVYEDALPYDYDPTPYLEISSYGSWKNTVDWALKLYQFNGSEAISEPIRAQLNGWKATSDDPEELARLVLRFVQDEIRYVGIEIGQNSWQPRPPTESFTFRFGDCKDKAVLACAMLRELNVEAHPALVNTRRRGEVAASLPTPLLFNHVIVQIVLDGKRIWVDPTRSLQRGGIRETYIPAFGFALPIREGGARLEEVKSPRAAMYRRDTIRSVRVLAYDQPVTMSIETNYRGLAADRVRRVFSDADDDALSRDFLNDHAETYPGIRDAKPLEIEDDPLDNVICVREMYTVDDFFVRQDEGQATAEIHPDGVAVMLPDPSIRIRKSPLFVYAPSLRTYKTIVRLPSKCDIEAYSEEVSDPAFKFQFKQSSSGHSATYAYSVETLKDRVEAVDTASLFKNVEKAESLIGDYVSEPGPESRFALNWWLVVGTLVYAVVSFTFLVLVIRSPRFKGDGVAEFPRIHGWLLLVGIGVTLSPFVFAFQLVIDAVVYFDVRSWAEIEYGLVATFELFGKILFLLAYAAMAYLFYAKAWLFPRFFVGLSVMVMVFQFVDMWLVSHYLGYPPEADAIGEVLKDLVRCTIWVPYMLVSKRVRGTFVH